MIIYHSREALTARLAALLHTGRVERDARPETAWEQLEPAEAYTATGLWSAGTDSTGQAVFAVGRSSRPDVAERVFHGIARVFGIGPERYLLVNVGPVQAWSDLAMIGLRRGGLTDLARTLEIQLLRRRWNECLRLVEKARKAARGSA